MLQQYQSCLTRTVDTLSLHCSNVHGSPGSIQVLIQRFKNAPAHIRLNINGNDYAVNGPRTLERLPIQLHSGHGPPRDTYYAGVEQHTASKVKLPQYIIGEMIAIGSIAHTSMTLVCTFLSKPPHGYQHLNVNPALSNYNWTQLLPYLHKSGFKTH